MNTDTTIEEQLSALLDGELQPDQTRFLLKRIARDPVLAARWERWQVASAALRRIDQRALPAGFAARVATALREDASPRGAHWRWGAGAALAASVAVAALLVPRPVGDPAADQAVADRADVAPVLPAITPVTPPTMSPVPTLSTLPLADNDALIVTRPWPRSQLDPRDPLHVAFRAQAQDAPQRRVAERPPQR